MSDREGASCSPTLHPDSICAAAGYKLCCSSPWDDIAQLILRRKRSLILAPDTAYIVFLPRLVIFNNNSLPHASLQPLDVEMFLGRVMEGRGVPKEDHLFYSILFRCGIYKGSRIGSKRKANILLNRRPPQRRQLQPSLSSFSLPALSSMTWFEDHLQGDQKVIFPALAPCAA